MHYYRYQDIYYSIPKLWELTKDIPFMKVNIKTIEYLSLLKNWRGDEGEKINIITVINNKEKYKFHYQKILNCDLKYPILVQIDFRIIDGYHRLAKAILEQKKDIKVKIVDPFLLNKSIVRRESNCPPRFVYYPSNKFDLKFVPKNKFTFVDKDDAIKLLENDNDKYLYIIRGNSTKYVKKDIYLTRYDMLIEKIIKD